VNWEALPWLGAAALLSPLVCFLLPTNAPQVDNNIFGYTNNAQARCVPVTYPLVRDVGSSQFTFPSGQTGSNALCWGSTCDASGELYVSVLGIQLPCPQGVSGLAACLTAPLHSHSPPLSRNVSWSCSLFRASSSSPTSGELHTCVLGTKLPCPQGHT
jgi:hypothetical protein